MPGNDTKARQDQVKQWVEQQERHQVWFPGRPAYGQNPPPQPAGSKPHSYRIPGTPAGSVTPVWYALVTRADGAEHEAVQDVRGRGRLVAAGPGVRSAGRSQSAMIIAIVLQLLLADQLTMNPLPQYLCRSSKAGCARHGHRQPGADRRRGPVVAGSASC